jgi:hypothetical protein
LYYFHGKRAMNDQVHRWLFLGFQDLASYLITLNIFSKGRKYSAPTIGIKALSRICRGTIFCAHISKNKGRKYSAPTI